MDDYLSLRSLEGSGRPFGTERSLNSPERARERNSEGPEVQNDGADETRFERERLDFYTRVRQGYESIWKRAPNRVQRIDASGKIDEVESAILAAARPFLAERFGVEL